VVDDASGVSDGSEQPRLLLSILGRFRGVRCRTVKR
jgi:hypothetical protein